MTLKRLTITLLLVALSTACGSKNNTLTCDIEMLDGSAVIPFIRQFGDDTKYDVELELDEHWVNLSVGVIRAEHESTLYAASNKASNAKDRLELTHKEYQRVWAEDMFHKVDSVSSERGHWDEIESLTSIWNVRLGDNPNTSTIGLWSVVNGKALFTITALATTKEPGAAPLSKDSSIFLIQEVTEQCQLSEL
ncbi:hypothetical protein F9L16_04420 [Agarivorans sp. B2Z047]|uniref:hypothetical protein n=1 Tax=Agarivorans sp. B2Z047 TaxID=2652721 RepID=UPI00128B1175|nr:hypothetical protein [Agarivorans sp. B2Z047]MPW28243.1 hypothetical protein [Agarivorans sp. B2Z047]UQN43928.1 hypothetical protein LQZ07_05520 [Agarivorans sp. B2Z047]